MRARICVARSRRTTLGTPATRAALRKIVIDSPATSSNCATCATASDSGAISYMDPDAISGYATVYIQQEYVNKTATAIMINEESRAGAALEVARDPSKLTAAEIETLLIRSAEIDLSFGTLQTTMKQLDDMYANALKGS
jgi:hypothetical protein